MTGWYRRAALAVATLALLSGTALAQNNQENQQDDRPPQARQQQQMQRRLAQLTQRLNLTDDQKRQWRQVNRETTQKIWAARKDDSLNEQQMQAQLREIHKQHDLQLLALLTPEQQAALKEFWEEQKQKQQERAADNNSANQDSSATSQGNDNGKQKDDDLFAGMVPDDPTPAPPQNKKAGRK